MTLIKVKPLLIPAASLVALLFSGCATISPETYRSTANGYNIAMQKVGEEQLLLNIVRLRYRDTPYFFETSAITSQLDLSTSAGLQGSFPLTGDGTDVLQGSSGISFSERPTISYTPLQGDEFFNRLLGRITFDDIALLTNSGWSMDTVLRLVVQRTNGLNNAIGASGPTPPIPPVYEEFREVSQILFDLQKTSVIQMGELTVDGEVIDVLHLPRPNENKSADRLRKLLSLDPSLHYYEVVPGVGLLQTENTELVEINTRSLLGVLFFLSQGVVPPEKHLNAGHVTRTLNEDGTDFDWNQPLEGVFKIHSSSKAPDNASTAIRYRGHWFYIGDDDLATKTTFMLLSQMFALRTGDVEGETPILTIPIF